ISAWEGYCYVYFDGKTGYIDASALSAVSPTGIGVRYTLAAGAPVLAHPASDEPVTFAEEMLVTVTDDAALLDGGAWRRISYEGKQYFVSANDLTLYVEPEPEIPEPERTFGRASADRPGGLINLYVAPDRSSAVLAEVVDGTRMEIVGESGDFWLVGFEGGIGYAAKSEIELEGLTTVQIVSIVLCCAVLVTGGVVFVVIWQTRKKEKEKE
ncbi:MAG TPA: SH3 domain-containing protein, partial [Candidatus Limadaptatus stercoravium]|nr:SH3 domain-containing protein [Candidatus Limadaptatus stercoravium]